jgi:hypothetical protein
MIAVGIDRCVVPADLAHPSRRSVNVDLEAAA